MSDEPSEFNIRRVDKAGDNRLWTAEDCLLDVLKELRTDHVGKDVQVVVLYTVGDKDNPDGVRSSRTRVANATRTTQIAMLTSAQFRAVLDYNNWLP